MATFEMIKKANESILTLNVKGKEYAMVNQRIKAFRMVYPNGSIITEIISLADGVVTMKATVMSDDGAVLGTGYAQEKESSSYINKTSYIENCETSCVGRALGMAGFGIDTSVASAEEVQNAIANQATDEPDVFTQKATTEQCKKIVELAKVLWGVNAKPNLQPFLDRYKVARTTELLTLDADELIDALKAEEAKRGAQK